MLHKTLRFNLNFKNISELKIRINLNKLLKRWKMWIVIFLYYQLHLRLKMLKFFKS